MSHKDLSDRTNGEELWLWRRRIRLSQPKAAATFGICEKHYWKAEKDMVTLSLGHRIKPSLGDLCALARRRHGKNLRAVAKMFDISHSSVINRERESNKRLVEAWEAKGYKFP